MTRDRLSELDEGADSAAARPLQPLGEDLLAERSGFLEHEAELLLQEVGSEQWLVQVADRGDLVFLPPREVLRVLPQGESRSLEFMSDVVVASSTGRIPDLATDLVQSLCGPGHYVEGIEAKPRLRTVPLNH